MSKKGLLKEMAEALTAIMLTYYHSYTRAEIEINSKYRDMYPVDKSRREGSECNI